MVEEDSHAALGMLMHYQHHSGVIAGALWDKFEKEALRLEAPSPVVSQSSVVVIESYFFKDQMLISNRLANMRLEKIHGNRDMNNIKVAM